MRKGLLWSLTLFLFLGSSLGAQESVPTYRQDSAARRTYGLVPGWIKYQAVRQGRDSCPALTDIVSHCRNPGTYYDGDPVTRAHETTHGVNSDVRNRYPGAFRKGPLGNWTWQPGKSNGCYVLNDRAMLLLEPPITLGTVASYVPGSLRGQVFQLYLVQMRSSWNNEPLYVLDEWTSYANGAHTRWELGLRDREETVTYATEFMGYAWSMLWAAWNAGYRADEARVFIMWHSERTILLIRNEQGALNHLAKMRTASDAENWRQSVRNIAGDDWTKRVLRF